MSNLATQSLLIFLIIWGVIMIWQPYRVARLSERVQAIGSTSRWETVEPASWRVTHTRVVGVITVVIGLVLVLWAW